MSGQDYPIKSLSYIHEELTKYYPKPFIDCTPYDRNNWIYHKFIYCASSIRTHDWVTRSFRKGILRSGFRVAAIIWTKLLSTVGHDSYHKLSKKRVELYGGSAWWILPDTIINYIYDRYQNKDEISEIILNESSTPEETYVQTMAMKSPLSGMIEINPKDMVLQNCKTWAYFLIRERDS